MISYAQNFEDVILWRALKGVGSGSYIDIGAHDPVADSISLSFYEKGWRGVHVEPAPLYAQMLREARTDEVVIQAAVGVDSKPITFWVFPGTGLSTGDPAIAAQHEADSRECLRIETPCIPLSEILDEHGAKRPIHWLKIDVEGMEHSVIQSWAPSKVRPWIVLVESTKPGTTESSHELWEPELLKFGYQFVYFDGLNRFYVSAEKTELKSVFGPGANIFDGFQLNQSSVFNQQLKTDLVWRNNEIQRLTQDLAASVALSNDRAAALVTATSAWETAASAFEQTTTSLQLRILDSAELLRQTEQNLLCSRQESESLQRECAALQQILSQREADLSLIRATLTSVQHALNQRDSDLRLTHAACGALQAELAAVRASTSWRVSAPVRWTGQSAKNALRSPLEIALRAARRHRFVKSLVWSVAAIAPPLKTKLIRFAEARSAPPPVPSSPAPLPTTVASPPVEPSLPSIQEPLPPLSLRARQVFADLKSPEP